MAQQTQTPTVEQVNPAEVTIGANIRRSDVTLSEDFVASIRENGVIIPISAYRDEDGAVVVVDGQMRTLAAIEAKVTQMPALIGTSRDEADRITEQWVANEHRNAMSNRDRFDAVEQLTMLKISAAEIARRTGVSKEHVTEVKKASKAGITGEQVEARPGISLAGLALLAKYADDPEAESYLTRHGTSDDALERRERQWLSAKEDEKILADARAEWEAKGATLTVVGYDDRRPAPKDLTTRDGKSLPTDLDTLVQMPGVQIALSIDHKSQTDDEGNRRTVKVAAVHAVVEQAASNGYMRRVTDDAGSVLDAEQAKQQRREATARKKAWAEAETERRAFLANLATAKTPPTGHEAVVATWLTRGSSRPLIELNGLLDGVEVTKLTSEAQAQRTTAKRRQVIATLSAFMQWEATTGLSTMHHPTERDRAMLRLLVKAGYQPSPIEKTMLK